MVKVKICGLTNVEDTLVVAKAGAWAAGFNFYSPSPRFIGFAKAVSLIAAIPPGIVKVGLFIDSTYEVIARTMDELGLDLAQTNRDIPARNSFKQRLILSLHTADAAKLPPFNVLANYGYVLLDAARDLNNPLWGGTGSVANWQLATYLAQTYRLILAGGLTALNVKEAITIVKPFAVDVATGVEKSPGHKNPRAIKQFLECCNDDE